MSDSCGNKIEKDCFADSVAKLCLSKYLQLPKTGKPLATEWTVLSCIIQYNSSSRDSNIEVVSLGTGTKCIGATKMSANGDILNDSHAEVIARRGFLKYLYEQLHKACTDGPSIFRNENGKFHLKEFVKFAFYSSQLPCGDAAILPKSDSDLIGDIINTNVSIKRSRRNETDRKKIKTDEATDVHRTGAKCVEGSLQDPHESGSSYHILGQVRTKPGRGDRTLSVSCSDKIARWIHVGIQGSLLDILLSEPISMSMFIFGSGVPYSENSLRRALLERNKTENCMCELVPEIKQSSVVFLHVRSENRTKPASGSILWVNTDAKIMEVAVLGKKLGVTKKSKNAASSQLAISKYSLYKHFLEILKLVDVTNLEILRDNETFANIPYSVMKKKSVRYYSKWVIIKEKFFGTWTKKDDIWKFTVEVS